MKKILSINIGGKVFQTNNDAYTKLEKYINHLENHFIKEEGGDEIMEDMEIRIAELLSEKTQNGSLPVNLDHVHYVVTTIGDPTIFDKDTMGNNTDNRKNDSFEPKSKKLFRDPDNKVLFGVCSGLGYYLGVDVLIIRIAFLVAFFFGIGTPFLLYLLIAFIVPRAKTYKDKARMMYEEI